MNSLLDDDDDEREQNNRELTLSTGTILGIFFGLVLLCGLFFGFGYKMGSHKATQPVEAATTDTVPGPASTFSDFKPAAGSPEGGNSAISPTPVTKTAAVSASTAATNTPEPAEAPVVRESPAALARTAAPAATTPTPSSVAAAGGTFFVQVAAVSHQEDADLLVNALQAKGYPVSAHTQPQDKFFHIQVGPFNTLKDAAAAKQRLLADGYQPIIK